VLLIALTVVAAVAAGVSAEHRYGQSAQDAARTTLRAMLYAVVPFIAFVNIAHLHVDVDVGAGIGLAYVTLAVVGTAAWLIGARVLRLSRPQTGALICSTVQANTGYVGLPLAVVALGSHRLGEAAAYDALVTQPALFIGVFGIGAAFGTRAGQGARARAAAFFVRNPPLIAVLAALVAPASFAPDALVDASRVLVFALLPAGFFIVGVTLAAEADEGQLAVPPPLTPAVLTALGLRLLVAPALLALLGLALIDLPDAYLLLAAMPCGINTLVVAHAYGLDLRIPAAAIAWSTGIVLAVAVVVVGL
jgi:predicted permease